MQLALVSFDIAWEDVPRNLRRAQQQLSRTRDLGATLAVLPEMFATGFSMNASRIAEAPDGPIQTFLSETAASLGISILAGVATQSDPTRRPVNEAILTSPSGERSRYEKLHPFSLAKEHEHYAGGPRVVTWNVDGIRVTPLVCYDLRFPEPFRVAAPETDLYIVIANWPDKRRAHWQTLLRARAIENVAYVAGVNRVGDGDGHHYAGDSALISPWGETIVSAAEEETILVANVDASRVEETRARFPFLADVRPEAYRR